MKIGHLKTFFPSNRFVLTKLNPTQQKQMCIRKSEDTITQNKDENLNSDWTV